ncbi:MAG: dienelactone hydrolase family protein [Candidatus Rokuibacteriota bacterium]|nr:MAG: dienelactone hydrolase family protein [Candidatus Rokubacteria bacterium]
MDIRTDTDSLPTADGLMPAYVCRPATGGPYPAVIVVMEAFGLNAHIKAVAERVAREGYVTIAPDFFYRFGSPIVPYEDVSRAMGYIQRLDDAALMAEMGVVIQHLKSLAEVRGDRIGLMGFCVGGRIAFLTACRHPAAVKVAIAFYGGGIAADTPTAPLHDAARIQCPVLCLFGEADRMIPMDQVRRLEDTLRRLKKTFEVKVYAGAGHGFFCDDRPSFHTDAAAGAWNLTSLWLSKYLN